MCLCDQEESTGTNGVCTGQVAGGDELMLTLAGGPVSSLGLRFLTFETRPVSQTFLLV